MMLAATRHIRRPLRSAHRSAVKHYAAERMMTGVLTTEAALLLCPRDRVAAHRTTSTNHFSEFTMKRVIDGKLYDTLTAKHICDLPCELGPSDFRWHETSLYKSPEGAYFLAGHGGPMSMWSKCENDGWRDGAGICLLTEHDAREYAENADLDVDSHEDTFGPCPIG
jgi:hypothetical protein